MIACSFLSQRFGTMSLISLDIPRVYIVYCKKKSALDSQPQMIKFTSCFPMVGGSPGTPASSTTKTGRHDIAEILLKVALNTKNQNQLHSGNLGSWKLQKIIFRNGLTMHKKSRGWTWISFSNGNLHNSSREDTLNEGTILLNLVPHITVICWKLDPEKTQSLLGWPLRSTSICVTNDHGYVPFRLL